MKAICYYKKVTDRHDIYKLEEFKGVDLINSIDEIESVLQSTAYDLGIMIAENKDYEEGIENDDSPAFKKCLEEARKQVDYFYINPLVVDNIKAAWENKVNYEYDSEEADMGLAASFVNFARAFKVGPEVDIHIKELHDFRAKYHLKGE